MKPIRLLPLALALLAPAAQAQYGYEYNYDRDYAYDYAPRSGDPTLDAVLTTINDLFGDEPDYYVEQIVYETRAPQRYVREYIVDRDYAPADVYMIGELSQLSGKSFTDVANTFDANRGRGWGVMAKELGIKPGSAQFHQLKNGTTVFVERGKAKRAKGGKGQVAQRETGRAPVAVAPGRSIDRGRGHGNDPGKGRGKDKGNGKGKGKKDKK
ncbi:MAG TPA: hypothetical protein VND91_10560 [Candidatus Saccharimonadia bacterium]|nr:hypothetical protein [Candidatus Saccharimonadia bacterium]